MTQIYYNLIKKGLKTIEDVPVRWKDEVQAMLEASPWYSVCYGNGLFVAVADSGTNRVMTSDVVREIV